MGSSKFLETVRLAGKCLYPLALSCKLLQKVFVHCRVGLGIVGWNLRRPNFDGGRKKEKETDK